MITKFDIFESVRDKMTPISDEKIKELHRKGKFSGNIVVEGYNEKQAKSIIRRYSHRLNDVFVDDTTRRVIDWLYQWKIDDPVDSDFSEIYLTLSCNRGTYTIDFVDNRSHSWKKIKNNLLGYSNGIGSDFQFREDFDLLEDALGWLEGCNIDVSKITRK